MYQQIVTKPTLGLQITAYASEYFEFKHFSPLLCRHAWSLCTHHCWHSSCILVFISEHLNLHLAIEKSKRQSDRSFVSLTDYQLHEPQCEWQEGSMTEPSLPLTFWVVQQVCRSWTVTSLQFCRAPAGWTDTKGWLAHEKVFTGRCE